MKHKSLQRANTLASKKAAASVGRAGRILRAANVHAACTIEVHDPGAEDSNNADSCFFALCSLRDVIAQACDNALSAIYLNESYECVVKLQR